MNSYRELFDADLGTRPVSTVDVDRVMAEQDRRARYRRIGTGGALGVMVAAVAVGFTVLHPTGGSARATQNPTAPRPPVVATPAPAHTPTTTETADRLTAALAQLPAGLHVPKDAAFVLLHAYQLDYYFVEWTYQGVHYAININDGDRPDFTINGCAPQYIGHNLADCTQDVTSAGITLQMFYPYHATKNRSLLAQYNLADGTDVSIAADTGTRLLLSKSLMPTLVAAAHNPGFTLHP